MPPADRHPCPACGSTLTRRAWSRRRKHPLPPRVRYECRSCHHTWDGEGGEPIDVHSARTRADDDPLTSDAEIADSDDEKARTRQ